MQSSGDGYSSGELSEGWERIDGNCPHGEEITETLKILEANVNATGDSEDSEDGELNHCALSNSSYDSEDAVVDASYDSNTLSHNLINSATEGFQPTKNPTWNIQNHQPRTTLQNHPVNSVRLPDLQSSRPTNHNIDMLYNIASSHQTDNSSSTKEVTDNENKYITDEHNMIPRMDNEHYSFVKSQANLYCEDVASDDEVWLIDCPITVQVASLMGQPVVFGGTSKIPVADQEGTQTMFEVVTSSKVPKPVACILPSRSGKGYRAVSLDVMGHLNIREKLKVPRVQIQQDRQTKVPFPTNLKVRHPLFGPDYKREINVARTISKRKKRHSSPKRTIDVELSPERVKLLTPKKEKSPMKLKLKKVKDLLADESEKKAKKRRHETEIEPGDKQKKRKRSAVTWEPSTTSDSEPPVKKKKQRRSEGYWAPFTSGERTGPEPESSVKRSKHVGRV